MDLIAVFLADKGVDELEFVLLHFSLNLFDLAFKFLYLSIDLAISTVIVVAP